ncbi:UDP-glucuronosyltransferase 3A1-like isoform X2 [Thrips palmi]|uniref:UDP-glucuronosyltransferase 3A1-like isoform X2 n=1 Tax=Thrips palmi TaxID=161013 RepID=A0A6P8YFK2_THRPL|nr:UDP-glucuronosyltransferase 3A1-like isoform X2 [Thrips palmi]
MLRVSQVVLCVTVYVVASAANPGSAVDIGTPEVPVPLAQPGDFTSGALGRPLRILAVMTVDTMSHHLWMAPLTVELAKRGHHVTSLDVAMPKEVPPTLNVTVIETAFPKMDSKWLRHFQESGSLEQMAILHKFDLDECALDLSAPAFRRILDPSFKDTFDLIVLDYVSDCQLGLAHRFGYPGFVVVSPFPGSPWLYDLMGNPAVPAVVCNTLVPFPHPMSLWQRAATAGLSAYMKLLEWYFRGEVDEVLRTHYGQDVPSAAELRRHVHIALVNDIPVLDTPQAYVPSVVPVGGMHVRPANLSNIPPGLADWLDEAENGFVLMSFGSVLKGSNLESETIRAFVEAFQELSDVRILWKMEPEVVGKASLPSNVRIEKWMPQSDILGHPKLRLFVSHCGGLSTHESSSNGVPMLGVPLLVDQFLNVDKVVRNGMARMLPMPEITKARFVADVKEMLQNSSGRCCRLAEA